MEQYKILNVKLEHKSYIFYNNIALFLKRPVEDILSDTLYKYAEIVMRKATYDE